MKLKIDWKHVLSVVAVLALVGGGAGAIIGTVNAFTADVISSNNQNKETAAFRECFPDAASFSDLVEVTGKTYVTGYRSALDASGNEIGKGYVVTGASGFGAPINLIVGVNEEGLVHVNLVSYGPDNTGGTTNVIEGWIDSINEDPANLENGVTTGASNSAGVIREMIAEALASYEGGGSTPLPDGAEKYLNLFEGATSVGEEVTLSGTYLTSYRDVYGANNALLGRGYLGAGTNGFGVHIEILVGLDTNYAVTGMSLEDYSGGTPAETEDTIKDWVDSVNEDPSNFNTAPSAGASYATIQSIVTEAISDYQNGGSSSENQKYLDLFEGAASTGNEVTVTGDYITSYREVYDSANTLLGRAYLGAGTNNFGVHIEILVGLDTNYAVTGMSLEDYSGGNPAETEDTIKDWVDSVNEDPSNFETAPSAGASYATIQSIVTEAISDYQNGGSSSGELTEEEQAAYDALLPDATWGDVQSAEGHDFVKTTRLALDDNGDTLATVYQATYEQSGDSLGILVSVDADKNIKVGYYTSSYDAAYVTGVKGWIEKINNGTVDYRDDIATSGCEQAAYSIAAMLDEVKEIAGITDPTENPDLTAPEEVTTMLPAASSWSEQVSISNVWYAYAYYSAYDAEGEEIGRVYAVRLETAADNTFYVALNADASFVEVKLISTTLTDTALTALNEWISSTNSSKTLTAPDSENAAASEINSLIGAIEDARRDYGVNVEEDISAKIGEVVAKNFGENAKYDTVGGNFTLDGTPEVGKTYYSVYVPSSDPLGGTPTYPGNVYVANIEEDSYSATLLISVGDLVTDEVSDVVSAVDVVSETGTRNEETVNRISTALVEYYKGTLPTDEPDEPVDPNPADGYTLEEAMNEAFTPSCYYESATSIDGSSIFTEYYDVTYEGSQGRMFTGSILAGSETISFYVAVDNADFTSIYISSWGEYEHISALLDWASSYNNREEPVAGADISDVVASLKTAMNEASNFDPDAPSTSIPDIVNEFIEDGTYASGSSIGAATTIDDTFTSYDVLLLGEPFAQIVTFNVVVESHAFECALAFADDAYSIRGLKIANTDGYANLEDLKTWASGIETVFGESNLTGDESYYAVATAIYDQCFNAYLAIA